MCHSSMYFSSTLQQPGIDVHKIVGFGRLDSDVQKELVAAFPSATSGFVQADAQLHPDSSKSCLDSTSNRKKRKGSEKRGEARKRPKEDPQEKILRVGVAILVLFSCDLYSLTRRKHLVAK